MKIERPNAQPPTLEELQDLEKLRVLAEQAAADGCLTRAEIEQIEALMRRDRKVTFDELELVQKLIYDKIQSGELVYDWG